MPIALYDLGKIEYLQQGSLYKQITRHRLKARPYKNNQNNATSQALLLCD
jgi:hypothetical protein